MKKTPRTLFAAIMIVATVAAFMLGCKKEQATLLVNNESTTTELAQGEATLARIMEFKNQMGEAKANPGLKTASYLSIADAVWNVEALFNLTYAYPDLPYSKTITSDTTLYLPVCTDDSVSLNDLTVFYDQMFNAVQAIYQSADLDDKQFLILDVEARERNGNLQAIELHTVQGSVRGEQPWPDTLHIWEPFEEGSPWYYGEDLGRLDGSFYGEMDAADTLSRMLNDHLVPKAPSGFTYIFTNIITKELADSDHCGYTHNSYPGCGPYCEFYKENPSATDYLLDTDQMNFHYFGERYLVNTYLRTYGNILVPSTHYLVNVTISDNKTTAKIWHHTLATYGHRDGISKNEITKGNL
jgi:hypothetical protein